MRNLRSILLAGVAILVVVTGTQAADQVLTCKLDDEMKIGIATNIGGEPATCKGLEAKDGKDVLKYAVGDQELVLEVEVVAK